MKIKKQNGLSMIEIMVASVISLILLAGLSQIYLANKQTFRMTESMSQVQENGRIAMDLITRSIRNADHWDCVGSFDKVTMASAITIDDFDEDSTNDNMQDFHSLTSSDKEFLSAGLSALNNLAVTGLATTPDKLRLISADQDGTSVNGSTTTNTVTLDDASAYSAGDLILINNCEYGQLVTISSISGNVLTLSDNLDRTYSGTATSNATVHKINVFSYSIGLNGTGNPALYMDDGTSNQELVEGVEDMQVLLGADTDGDLVPDYYVDPETTNLNLENVVSLRLTLTVRSTENNQLSKQYRTMLAIRNRLN